MKTKIVAKKVLTVVLSATLLLSAIFCVPMLSAEATGVKTQPDTMSVEDWKNLEPFNGDFEAGVEGAEPMGWSKEPIDNNTAVRYTDDTYNNYRNQYTLTTEVDNGNKVLAINKNGSGYIGAASQPVSVIGGCSYTISFDYMLKSVVPTVDGATATKYLGTRLYVEEFDADGNSLATAQTVTNKDDTTQTAYKLTNLCGSAETYDAETEWTSVSKTFTVSANAASVVFYLYVGGQYQLRSVTYFDNVEMTDYGHNFDFEAGETGEATYNFVEVSVDNNTNKKTNTNYSGAYELLNADDNGNQVLAIKKTGAGYIAAASIPYEVVGGGVYNISLDYMLKEYSIKSGATNGLNYLGTRFLFEELDSEGNIITSMGNSTVLMADHVNVTAADTDWKSAECTYTASANAAYVVFYFYSGGQWNMYSTTYFDNLVITHANPVVDPGFNMDFEASGDAASWRKETINNSGVYDAANTYVNAFDISTVDDNGNKVLSVHKKASGYIAAASMDIPVLPSTSYTASAMYKQVLFDTGSATSGTSDMNNRIYIGEKDAEGNITLTSNVHGGVLSDWNEMRVSFTTKPTTVSVVIFLWVGAQWNVTKTVYFDNVILFENNVSGWTSETCKENGMPRGDTTDFTGNYGIGNLVGDDDGFVLYVKRSGGILGGAVYYSDAIPVIAGTEYTWNYDRKIENSTDDTSINIFGASAVLRWLDADGNPLTTNPQVVLGRNYNNMDWTNMNLTATAPEGAASVKLGYVIGGYVMNKCPDLRYSYDNIVFMETDKIGKANKPSDVTSVLLENVKDDVDILDLVLAKAAADTKAYNAEYDINMTKSNTIEDTYYIRAKMFGLTTYEQLKSIF